METKKIYLANMHQLECDATIIDMKGNAIILDQTVFYAQGGGQPYDQGIIESPAGKFLVQEVKTENGGTLHKGIFESEKFKIGEKVHCSVNAERRKTNTCCHSAGHVIDRALHELGIDWPQDRGYHYAEGAYDSYFGHIENSEALKPKLEKKCAEIITRGEDTSLQFYSGKEAKEKGMKLAPFIQDNDEVRVVYFGNSFGLPCGGTHVKNLKDIRKITIRKIKNDGDKVKISYASE